MARDTRTGVLRVDLDAGSVTRERVPASWRRDFLGGKGLGARYLYEETPANVDPLGPDALFAFVQGPLSGYLPGESRVAAVTKSPLTGAFLDSYVGGSFAASLAGALGDNLGLLVTGRADDPVALVVEDGGARLRSAADLWGADAVRTDDAFPDDAVACVGPAGENRVAYATVAVDGGDHQCGRGGAGAVMGAKHLKAVVARGDAPDALADLRERYADAYRDGDTGRWQAAGATLESLDFANEVGVLPTRGWQASAFEGADGIGVEAAKAAATDREDGPVPGGFRVETDAGEHVPRGGTLMSLGAGLGIDEFDAVTTLGAVCDRLGVDVISAGNAVAWAMRAAEAGHLDRDLAFGDEAAARDLLEDVVARETALGDTLAEGVDAAAAAHPEAPSLPTVKSMELPGYDPRGAAGMALAYATSDRGGCHRRARPIETEAFAADRWTTADRVEAVVTAQNARSVLWSLVADDFAGETLWGDLGAEYLAAVGREYDPAELERAGERIWTLIRLFNAREGFDRDDDRLPPSLSAGDGVDRDLFADLLDAYYAARGWDGRGVPTRGRVRELGLRSVCDDFGTLPDTTEAHSD